MPIAVGIHAPGGPDALQVLDVEVPPPEAGEVQIAQTVAGVNFVDVYHRIGLYPLARKPAALGFEGAGRVVAVGPNVTTLKTGDRVAYHGQPIGAYAEIHNLPGHRLVKLPDTVSDRVAGCSMLRGLTAHTLLFKVRPVQPSDWVLIHAAAGGLGQLVTRWPNHVWAADITYIPIGRGSLYLVAIIDWASRAVLAIGSRDAIRSGSLRQLSNTLDTSFCLAALEEALARFGTPEIFNTDSQWIEASSRAA